MVLPADMLAPRKTASRMSFSLDQEIGRKNRRKEG